MDRYIYDTVKLKTLFGTYRLQIIQDTDAESPREWDNLGTMICFHNRYNLGDYKEAKQYRDEEHFLSSIAGVDYDELYDRIYERQPKPHVYPKTSREAYQATMQKIMELVEKNNVILPLYLYDHSGITMSTGRFSCPWDSGQVGWIYASHEKIRKEYSWKKLTKDRLNKIVSYLEGEVKTYDQFITNDVYGFKLFAPPSRAALQAAELTEDDIDDKNIEDYCEELDSCWGFYGYDWETNGMKEHVCVDSYVKERIQEHLTKVKQWIRNRVPHIYRQPLAL